MFRKIRRRKKTRKQESKIKIRSGTICIQHASKVGECQEIPRFQLLLDCFDPEFEQMDPRDNAGHTDRHPERF